MKFFLFILLLALPLRFYAQILQNPPSTKRLIPFNDQWLFSKGKLDGAQKADYNDRNWRKVHLPHDWSIEDLPNQIKDSIVGPFHKGSIGGTFTGYTVGGTAWYRKKFKTNVTQINKQVIIHFDGIYKNSDVWLNGHFLGNHRYGYSAFNYDLTPYLKPAGQENVLAVKVNNEGKNSRWYSGSGIYRHVWLTVTNKLNVVNWGVYVTTPVVLAGNATVHIQTAISNQEVSNRVFTLQTTIRSNEGKMISRSQKSLTVTGKAALLDEQDIQIEKAVLWSIETPSLYIAVTEIKEGIKVIDRVETTFGIRTIKIDATTGLTLNGKKVLLKGGCIHHDNGPLGAVTIDRAEERKVEILKKNGFNAIRTSHNPPSKQFLDACDRIGMLVIDEAFDIWTRSKNDNDYHLDFKGSWNKDITSMVLRDRNHPSIILWSIGNEIPERADSTGIAIRKMLKQRVKELDPTRLITEAINRTPGWEKRTPAVFEDLDVGGYNYVIEKYEADHQKFPDRIIVGTESYPFKALENWDLAESHPYILGDFVWTAFDYLGEASVGHSSIDSLKVFKPNLFWPWFNGFSGDIDLIGNKKTPSYYRDVVWRNRSIVTAVHSPIPHGMVENISNWGWPDEILSWTWPGQEGKPLQVRVFSRAAIVRLYLNGKNVGEQKLEKGSIVATFSVPYQPGILKAINIVNGKETDAFELKTTGVPKRIRLTADRSTINADRNDLSYVMVDVVDDKGDVVPHAEIAIKFTISGPGEIAAVGNASPTDMASFQKPERKTINGTCLVIVRPMDKAGTITIKATAQGLSAGKITINTK